MAGEWVAVSPAVPFGLLPFFSLGLLALGLVVLGLFIADSVSKTASARSLVGELLIAAISSASLGFGSILMLVWCGLYV